MLRQFLFGGSVSACNIAIHALVMTTIIRTARAVAAKKTLHPSLLLTGVMTSTVAVLMITHSLEVIVWSVAYSIVDIAPPGVGLVYFAFVNFTTLGYGDIIPKDRWQLLGPMTAMNGVLLFGWSTAVIFEVLRRALTVSFPVLGIGRGADAFDSD
jgi:voltage-gated potassium channel Kch